MKNCVECRVNPIPPQREKFCSAECALRHKRKKTRMGRAREHRHHWVCASCGKQTSLGRKRVLD